MGSRSGFDSQGSLDELQNVVDVGSGAVSVATRQAQAQYNIGINGTAVAITAGTVKASSMVVVDANKDISTFRNLTATNHLAGASGTAGSVQVYPVTAASGSVKLTAANSAGDYLVTIVNASYGQAATLTIPDVGASTGAFVMDKGTSTLSGAKTFTGGVTISTTALTVTDVNIALSATTGTKIGTATTQKLGFYNATPVQQQATTGTSSGFTAGSGTAVKDDSTFTGNSGSTAYRISDVVLALKNLGLLAA